MCSWRIEDVMKVFSPLHSTYHLCHQHMQHFNWFQTWPRRLIGGVKHSCKNLNAIRATWQIWNPWQVRHDCILNNRTTSQRKVRGHSKWVHEFLTIIHTQHTCREEGNRVRTWKLSSSAHS